MCPGDQALWRGTLCSAGRAAEEVNSKAAQKFRAVCGGFCAKREKVSTGYYASDGFALINMYRVYLKSRKFSLFLQTQLDLAWNSLEIHKGFLRLFALNPACACEIFVIFFVFRYTLGPNGITDETPIRILYIGHIKYVQWSIFDGNIFWNALKKPLKPKNWLRNLWKKYMRRAFCWTRCTTFFIYQCSRTT